MVHEVRFQSKEMTLGSDGLICNEKGKIGQFNDKVSLYTNLY